MNARDDLDLTLGMIVAEAKTSQRYVFVGWFGPSTVGTYDALFVREGQPGERVGLTTPWMYRCVRTETLIRRFPELEQYRKKETEVAPLPGPT